MEKQNMSVGFAVLTNFRLLVDTVGREKTV